MVESPREDSDRSYRRFGYRTDISLVTVKAELLAADSLHIVRCQYA